MKCENWHSDPPGALKMAFVCQNVVLLSFSVQYCPGIFGHNEPNVITHVRGTLLEDQNFKK